MGRVFGRLVVSGFGVTYLLGWLGRLEDEALGCSHHSGRTAPEHRRHRPRRVAAHHAPALATTGTPATLALLLLLVVVVFERWRTVVIAVVVTVVIVIAGTFLTTAVYGVVLFIERRRVSAAHDVHESHLHLTHEVFVPLLVLTRHRLVKRHVQTGSVVVSKVRHCIQTNKQLTNE